MWWSCLTRLLAGARSSVCSSSARPVSCSRMSSSAWVLVSAVRMVRLVQLARMVRAEATPAPMVCVLQAQAEARRNALTQQVPQAVRAGRDRGRARQQAQRANRPSRGCQAAASRSLVARAKQVRAGSPVRSAVRVFWSRRVGSRAPRAWLERPERRAREAQAAAAEMWWVVMGQAEAEAAEARVVAAVREARPERTEPTWWAWSSWAKRQSSCASRSPWVTAAMAVSVERAALAVREVAVATFALVSLTGAPEAAVVTEAQAVSAETVAAVAEACRLELYVQRALRCVAATS